MRRHPLLHKAPKELFSLSTFLIQIGRLGGLQAQARVLPPQLNPKLQEAIQAGNAATGVPSPAAGPGGHRDGARRSTSDLRDCRPAERAPRPAQASPAINGQRKSSQAPQARPSASESTPAPGPARTPLPQRPISPEIIARVPTPPSGRGLSPAIPQNWRTETPSAGSMPKAVSPPCAMDEAPIARAGDARSRASAADWRAEEAGVIGTAVYDAGPAPKSSAASYPTPATAALDDDASLFAAELAAREARYGSDHAEVADALSNLAIVYNQRGDVDAALPLYRRALRIWERALGPDHLDVAQTLTDIAVIHLEKVDS